MKLTTLFLTISTVLCCVYASNFVVGNVANRVVLVNHTLIEYNAIPFMKRVKYYFYSLPGIRKIEGIQALDTLHSKASINITAGGVGHSFVNMRMKSERGRGLSYDIGIYVAQDEFYRT
ncbi:uncharacterized protein LOC113515954 [Galleria mellonella]|uniref:Uncharacterized protein LOC113515954 n=1 Tax=Galleria mellonella TaxID=7137 RepID=A0A6J1WUI1_GALME|nr:uncharacterized protein LOC113515954 [Galleria mellonella]